MKTSIEPTRKDRVVPRADWSAGRPGRRFAAAWRFLALAWAAGLGLTAQAQTTATATATVVNGFVVAYTVTDGGSGYTEPPVVTVVGGGGTGATAVALVANGAVTQIKPVSAGSGYTSPPEVVISAPPAAEPPLLALQMIPLVTLHGLPGDTNQIETKTAFGAGRCGSRWRRWC